MKTKNTGSMKICNKNVRNITTWQIDNIKEGYIIGENDEVLPTTISGIKLYKDDTHYCS